MYRTLKICLEIYVEYRHKALCLAKFRILTPWRRLSTPRRLRKRMRVRMRSDKRPPRVFPFRETYPEHCLHTTSVRSLSTFSSFSIVDAP